MTVKWSDMVDNNDGELTWLGYKFTSKLVVTDPVAQSARADDAVRVFEAINDTGVPNINDPHPAVASCLLRKIKAVAIEPNWIELQLFWETPDGRWQQITVGQKDISMDSSVIQTETTKDYSGANLAPLSYEYQIGDQNPQKPLDESGEPNLLTSAVILMSEIPVVPVFIPARILTYSLRMQNTDEEELEDLNDAYQGTVNNATWRGYATRLWLCMGITWRTTDNRDTFIVKVQYQYKFDTYDVQSVFRDPYSGKVPGDVFSHTGEPAFRNYRIQREADFGALDTALGV